MAWILVPSLVSLRAEINALAPKRDKASDGAIGDGEHSQNSSDHNPDETGRTPTEDADSTNEVHAIDVDKDGPWPAGWSMERCVQSIVLRHRSGRDNRLQNVIYNRRIWSRTWGWTARAYTRPNPHDHHAHFSARYTTAQENDTRPWGLLEAVTVAQTIAKTQEEDVELTDKVVASNNESWTTRFGANAPTVANALAFSAYNATDAEKVAARIDAKVDQVVALLTALTGKDFTDETAIVAGVLAGLDAEAIAAAIPDDIARQVAEELHTRLAG